MIYFIVMIIYIRNIVSKLFVLFDTSLTKVLYAKAKRVFQLFNYVV